MKIIKQIFWYSVGFLGLAALIWNGFCHLVGADIMINIARDIAFVAAYTFKYVSLIAIPITAVLFIFSLSSVPIAFTGRMFAVAKEAFAKAKMYRAKTLAIVSDAEGRNRQSRFITASGRSIVAIDTCMVKDRKK